MTTKSSTARAGRANCLVAIIIVGSVILLALGIVITQSRTLGGKDSKPASPVEADASDNAHRMPAMIRTSKAPTASPTPAPQTNTPTIEATIAMTTSSPTSPVTYRPGVFLNVSHQDGLFQLSEGLIARVVAMAGVPVTYENGQNSESPFHSLPGGGAIVPDVRPNNPGGWVYVSNSNVEEPFGSAGVGAITFSADGQILDYRRILMNTTSNSGGGKTPWNSFVTCEERFQNGTGAGRIYQVDPLDLRQAEVTSLGEGLGVFASFAYDVRNVSAPLFFATEARRRGAVRRFTPHNPNWNQTWSMLHGNGTLDYLVLTPSVDGSTKGTFMWVEDSTAAKMNAGDLYPGCEQINVVGNYVYLVSQTWQTLHILNLDNRVYRSLSTKDGVFGMGRIHEMEELFLDKHNETLLYTTDEPGTGVGIHALDRWGQVLSILKGHDEFQDESAGLAFSPNRLHMLVAFQQSGVLLDVTRMDGYPFHGRALDLKYHTP
jgi:hypothetical protein